MKGEMSVWYLILIAVAVVSMAVIGYIANSMIESAFISALNSAFN